MSANIPSVTEVIADRILSGSQPGQREDDCRVGIIIQGGGMRGVIGAGASVALQSLIGNSEPFDRSDATSAGAFSWSGLVSRNGVESTSIYYEELAKGFMSLRNRWQKGKFVDLGILMRAVNEGEKAFDFERILDHPTNSSFYASSVHDAQPVEFRMGRNATRNGEQESDNGKHVIICRTPGDVSTALESSAQIPYFAGPPIKLPDGRQLVDGGITEGRVPLTRSIEAGCTHILVVSTDRDVEPSQYPRKKIERLAAWAIHRRYTELAKNYWQGHERHKGVLEQIRAAESNQLMVPKIEVIRADERFIPGSSEVDPSRMYVAAKAGEQAVLAAFAPYGISRDKDITVRMPR